jgi:secreted PhoX family phosphatase
MFSRRAFIRSTGVYSAAFFGLRAFLRQPVHAASVFSPKLGNLVPAAGGLIHVPEGFSCQVFSFTGEEMVDGLLVPGGHDGMAAFAGPGGKTILVRNHELESAWTDRSPFGEDGSRFHRVDPAKVYDLGHGRLPGLGGTTTVVFDTKTQKFESHFLSLVGTQRNCAGGPTPWGTWITCEEVNAVEEPDAEKLHGYNFEVYPTIEPSISDPLPLKAMGRVRHEAVAVEPKSGVVYQTEDMGDGLLYRFIPNELENLAAGGRLQALAIRGSLQADTRNWLGTPSEFPIGRPLAVEWIDLEDVDSPVLDLRHRGRALGAAIFARGEGAWWAGDSAYFAMTNGGRNTFGQIFRYVPSPFEGTEQESGAPGTLELFVEPNDTGLLRNCDNLTIAPWGDIVIAEDHKGSCRLIGITPTGEYYLIAANPAQGKELAGVCFSPDGSTLFVNSQKPGFTVAISGPWPKALA